MRRVTFIRGTLVCAALAALVVGLLHFASSRTLSEEERKAAEKGIYRNGVPLATVRARGWPGLGEWEEAVAKFPTLDSCLVSNRAGHEALTVDWWKVSSDVEASVCLSRVASKVRSADNLARWFEQHGFRVVSVRPVPWTQTPPQATERTGTAVETSWLTKTNGPLYKGGLLTWALQRLDVVYGISCPVFFGDRKVAIWAHCTSHVL
jgi:hypothetical protein